MVRDELMNLLVTKSVHLFRLAAQTQPDTYLLMENFISITAMPVTQARLFYRLSRPVSGKIADKVIKEIHQRLEFLAMSV